MLVATRQRKDLHLLRTELSLLSLLSRQTESVRDHKFHSGMLIHRWIGGTLFRTCIKLKSKQRETVVHLSLCAFRKCVQKWGYVYFFKNKWNGLPTFQFWIEAALFSANLCEGIFFWNDFWQDFPRFICYYQKLFWILFCALIAF